MVTPSPNLIILQLPLFLVLLFSGCPQQQTTSVTKDLSGQQTIDFSVKETRLFLIINQLRIDHQQEELTPSLLLTLAARLHAMDLSSNKMAASHEGSNGSLPWNRSKDVGYKGFCVGENVFWISGNELTPEGVLKAWVESKGHYANLINPKYKQIGLSILKEHAVAVFGCE